jgi:hypothetical protein
MSFARVMPTARGRGPTPAQIARRVADCADRFLGAAMHDSATINPDMAFGEASGPDLMRLAAAQLRAAEPQIPAAAWTSARSAAASPSYLSA